MQNLAKIKKRFITIVAVLGFFDLVLLAYLVWPGSGPGAKKAQEDALREEQKQLNVQVAPLRNIDKTLAQTRVDIQKLYDKKVPSQFSQISQHLEKLVQETGVSTQATHYANEKNDEKTDLPDVQRVSIDTTVTGDYAKVARFVNALEQDKFVFVINQISLSGSEGGNSVSLQIKFETFLKQT
jgi:Tfp pilus assembly protein PilO